MISKDCKIGPGKPSRFAEINQGLRFVMRGFYFSFYFLKFTMIPELMKLPNLHKKEYSIIIQPIIQEDDIWIFTWSIECQLRSRQISKRSYLR